MPFSTNQARHLKNRTFCYKMQWPGHKPLSQSCTKESISRATNPVHIVNFYNSSEAVSFISFHKLSTFLSFHPVRLVCKSCGSASWNCILHMIIKLYCSHNLLASDFVESTFPIIHSIASYLRREFQNQISKSKTPNKKLRQNSAEKSSFKYLTLCLCMYFLHSELHSERTIL